MSMAPLFELAHGEYDVRPDAYDYERFRTAEHLIQAITRHAGNPKTKLIYVGNHGRREGLAISRGSVLPLSDIARAIAKLDKRSKVHGVYLSACQAVDQRSAQQFLKIAKNIHWVAGYGAVVNWTDSAALDMMFFSRWLEEQGAAGPRIKKAAASMVNDVGSFARSAPVSFGIFARARTGSVENLMAVE